MTTNGVKVVKSGSYHFIDSRNDKNIKSEHIHNSNLAHKRKTMKIELKSAGKRQFNLKNRKLVQNTNSQFTVLAVSNTSCFKPSNLRYFYYFSIAKIFTLI